LGACQAPKKMKHPVTLSNTSEAGKVIFNRLEKTGVANEHRGIELLRDLVTGHYWLSEYQEQGFGSWEGLTSMSKEMGEAIVQHPEMLAHFINTREWVIPNKDKTNLPVKLSSNESK